MTLLARNEVGKAKKVADELKIKTIPRMMVRISLQMLSSFLLLRLKNDYEQETEN